MIAIIDYGLGNVGSLLNMCKHIGMEVILSSEKKTILSSSHLILPGVGSFDTGMKNLQERSLETLLNEDVLRQGKPILGICLGAQLMLQSSEEGIRQGLGWVSGKVLKFKNNSGIKIPHMGWNSLNTLSDRTLFDGMPDEPPRFYFVHSYHFSLDNTDESTAQCYYGYYFTAAFQKGNVIGVQFHPEKSHLFGMKLLANFFKMK